jgi:AraC-like DNA-binding protein
MQLASTLVVPVGILADWLLHSALPVKQIAAECGVDDLQKFNKCMRAEYGQSPRSLREEHRKKSGEKTWTLEQG